MTPDLPEALTEGREHIYLSWFYRTFAYRPDAITPADLDEYVRTYSQPGAMRAGFAYYRALLQDITDNKAVLAQGQAGDAGVGDRRRRELSARARTRPCTGAIAAAGRARCARRRGPRLRPFHSRRGARRAHQASVDFFAAEKEPP